MCHSSLVVSTSNVVQVHVEKESDPWKQRGREGLCANTNVSLVCEREGRRRLFLFPHFVVRFPCSSVYLEFIQEEKREQVEYIEYILPHENVFIFITQSSGTRQPTNRCQRILTEGNRRTDVNGSWLYQKSVIPCPACEPVLTYPIYTYYWHIYLKVSWFETFTNKTKTTFKKLI